MEFTVAITGASGSIYAQRTLMHMSASGVVERINLIMSEAATTVAKVELGVDLTAADPNKINRWLGLSGDSADSLAPSRQCSRKAGFGFSPTGRNGDCPLLDGHSGSNRFRRGN